MVKKGRLPICPYSVQKQSPGNLDCGIYSAVNIWLLLSHVDPGKFEVDEKSLRSKVLSSFCSNKWTITANKLRKPRGSYCIFRM